MGASEVRYDTGSLATLHTHDIEGATEEIVPIGINRGLV